MAPSASRTLDALDEFALRVGCFGRGFGLAGPMFVYGNVTFVHRNCISCKVRDETHRMRIIVSIGVSPLTFRLFAIAGIGNRCHN